MSIVATEKLKCLNIFGYFGSILVLHELHQYLCIKHGNIEISKSLQNLTTTG